MAEMGSTLNTRLQTFTECNTKFSDYYSDALVYTATDSKRAGCLHRVQTALNKRELHAIHYLMQMAIDYDKFCVQHEHFVEMMRHKRIEDQLMVQSLCSKLITMAKTKTDFASMLAHSEITGALLACEMIMNSDPNNTMALCDFLETSFDLACSFKCMDMKVLTPLLAVYSFRQQLLVCSRLGSEELLQVLHSKKSLATYCENVCKVVSKEKHTAAHLIKKLAQELKLDLSKISMIATNHAE
ncbi:hypothetical protein CYMTET_41257 [Cymbomonas tetramitiformis]|uniref:Uncharacterized protein n=1 Tax=Cymbomonas tetramitiformis TaxID=36881 RepID=A0AAE0C8L6_9CHLO|nr:hypothetical protein CYMTET_41257 [Cymbomonas tetramitiformis]